MALPARESAGVRRLAPVRELNADPKHIVGYFSSRAAVSTGSEQHRVWQLVSVLARSG
jgi:hypothetical protein